VLVGHWKRAKLNRLLRTIPSSTPLPSPPKSTLNPTFIPLLNPDKRSFQFTEDILKLLLIAKNHVCTCLMMKTALVVLLTSLVEWKRMHAIRFHIQKSSLDGAGSVM